MAKKRPPNAGKPWTASHVAQLRREGRGNTPTRLIGLHLGRTEDAARRQASTLDVSLKPPNHSPYSTRKKQVRGVDWPEDVSK